MGEEKIDNLIKTLCCDCGSLKKSRHPLWYLLPWLAITIVFAVFVVRYAGIRHDFATKVLEPMFVFEIALVMVLGLFSAISSAYLMIPDMCNKKWLIPVTFTLGSIFMLLFVVKICSEGMQMPKFSFDHCMQEGLYISLLPLSAMILLMRSGATTHPVLLAVMNILSVATIGYIALRFTCSMDSVGHATLMHLVPYIAIGSVVGLLARRLYKW